MEPITKYYLRPKGRGIKLHLGCGDYWFDGYVNIDINVYGGTDMLYDIRKGLPFQPEVAEIIEAYEVLEHFNSDETFDLLEDWKRVLIPGGKIKISVPDMDGLIAMYPNDKDQAMKMIYGFVDHPNHKQGFTLEKITKLFEDHGFKIIEAKQGSVPERKDEPQLLVEVQKNES